MTTTDDPDAPRGSVLSGTPPACASSDSVGPRTPAGTSSSNRCTGSHTTVPACATARAISRRVRSRKSPAVLDIDLSKVPWAWLWRAQ